jgi:glycosyltransferase involved in cell wall biosynthesis
MTSEALRVLQVHNRYRQLGGEDAVVAAEGELLRRQGHEVIEHIVTNPTGGVASAARLAVAPWNPINARTMRGVVRESTPDIAHVHNTWFSLSPSVVGALHSARVPVVVTLHNYRLVCLNGLLYRDGAPCRDCVGGSPLPGVRHRCYRRSASSSAVAAATLSFNRARGTWVNSVDRFIAPSRGLRDTLVAGGLPEDRVVVRPHAVADVGRRVQPPSASKTLLYAGRISEEKGLGVLLEAWRLARPCGLELVVAGDGPLRAELEARSIEGVRFAGWLPPAEVHELMLTSRALAFPSVCYESFGSTIIEAMSAGLPVIASAHGAPAEIVGEVGAVWLAEPGDVPSWVQRLGNLADDRALDTAAARGREIYENRYATTQGIASLVDIYRRAIDAAARR